MLTLILGGARSGKSRLAQKLASNAGRVTYIATAQPAGDSEMVARIARHHSDRPAAWQTIEEPLALAGAVEQASHVSDTILVDCLTIWLSNLFWEHRDAPPDRLEDTVRAALPLIAEAGRRCRVILVSNELGCGTVPDIPLTRAFRDMQGLLNQWTADIADKVILTVAGLPMYLKGPS